MDEFEGTILRHMRYDNLKTLARGCEAAALEYDASGRGQEAGRRGPYAGNCQNRTVRKLNKAAAVLIALSSFLGASPALADLKLCNTTPSRIGVAVGYQDPKGWATEGWWTIPSKTCETLLKGKLPSRFYYIHAIDYDRGGEWKGPSLMCTARQSFIIRGVDKCKGRGYKKTGFFEVDTGNARNWTIRLSDPLNKTKGN